MKFKSVDEILDYAIGKEQDAADFYKAYYEFYLDQIKQGVTPAKGGERYRLIWNGIPIWHHLQLIDYFEKKGANFVWEPYTDLSWGNKTPSGRLDPEADGSEGKSVEVWHIHL